MDIENLTRAVNQASRALEREIGEAKALATRAKSDFAEAEVADARADALEKVIGFLNSFADTRQAEVQRKVEALVTHGLQTVFDDSLTFHVVSETKARRVETRFVVRSKMGDQVVETSILDARGGGVAAVAGFLLRLIVLLLRPGVRPFMVLDESFGQLSSEYEPRLAEFLRELSDKTPVQMLLITHSPEFEAVADVAYRSSLRDGKTHLEAIK